MSLKNTYIVEKSNVLNEIKSTNMSLQELRFFSIYLAKINARNVSTRCVRFPLSDFQKIMEIGRMNIKHFKTTVNGLLCKVIHMPTDKGGLCSFQLFKEVDLFKDDSDSWVVEIDAHDKALPLLFNLKKNYFTYELWNALRLKSVNQFRMYELLKQHERSGRFEIKVLELREYLGLVPGQYGYLKDFRNRVLDSCQKALEENTDICYTYEQGKVGSRGKWLTIVFHISKNTNYKDPMGIDDFMDKQPEPQPEDKPQSEPEQTPKCPSDERPQPPEHLPERLPSVSERQPYLSCVFEKDLSPSDIEVLCDLLACKVPTVSERKPELLEKRLRVLYGQMLVSSTEPVKKPVAYLKSIIINCDPDKLPPISTKDDDFDIDMYKICINNFDVIDFASPQPKEEPPAPTMAEIEKAERDAHWAELLDEISKISKRNKSDIV